MNKPCRLIGFPQCGRDARGRCASQTRQHNVDAVNVVVDKTQQRLQGSGTEGDCVAHARLAKKQIRCGLSRAFFMTTRSGPQAVRPSFATRPVPVSQLEPDFDGWILMSCIRCCRDMAESGSRACDRHGRLTCMASALVCGAERPAPFGTLPCSPAFSCIHAESGKLKSIRKRPVKRSPRRSSWAGVL